MPRQFEEMPVLPKELADKIGKMIENIIIAVLCETLQAAGFHGEISIKFDLTTTDDGQASCRTEIISHGIYSTAGIAALAARFRPNEVVSERA